MKVSKSLYGGNNFFIV